jgi:Mur ligase family, catalytic domain
MRVSRQLRAQADTNRQVGGSTDISSEPLHTGRIPALADLGRMHIMGIAGSGMSALARILFDREVPVSGCEARESVTVAGLRALGAGVVIGHSPRHPDDTGTFVFTTAVTPRHEELVAARESGKLVMRRAAAPEDRRCVAVAGTHGRPRRLRCWWSRCRRAAWTRPSPTESSSNDPADQQAVTLTPHDTLIHRP